MDNSTAGLLRVRAIVVEIASVDLSRENRGQVSLARAIASIAEARTNAVVRKCFEASHQPHVGAFASLDR